MKIKKGDKVKVLLGKDRGKEGVVQFVLAKKGRAFVEGANIYKRHVRKQGQTEGGIINLPKSMDISNVAFICPNCKRPTRVGFKMEKEGKIRICRRCQKII